MTHQNHQTNGASLEDCHTNFFALTDLCGIKWRKFVNGERHNASADPLDDPILRSYSRCMSANMLCVWRRIQSTKQDQPDPNNAMSYDICTSKIHPPLSFAASKELWIFWYGEEPDLNGLVDTELLRVSGNQMNWNGTWENGLTYECRSLLFKALHNLMERFVLTKDIVRFGKWFVQPCTTNDRIFGKSSQHLSFSFTFFVHGDTVCASIDLREHPAVRQLTAEHLADAAAASAAAQSGQQDVRQRSVILAPFGMAATLTGNSYKTTDPLAEKILEDWASFFPLCNKETSDLPPVVEVVSGGHKMYHPSKYVLVTDLDDMDNVLEEATTDQSQGILAGLGLSASAAASSSLVNPRATPINHISPPTPSACGLMPVSKATPPVGVASTHPSPSPGGGAAAAAQTTTTGVGVVAHQTDGGAAAAGDKSNLKKFEHKTQPFYATSRNNTHAPPQASTEMPERVWQDCITNPISSLSLNSNTCDIIKMEVSDVGGDVSMNNNNNSSSSDTKTMWNFVDPSQKAQCTCTRCKKTTSGSRSTCSSSSTTMLSSAAANKLTGSSGSSSARPDKSTRFTRIPFHKRHTTDLGSCSNSPLYNTTSAASSTMTTATVGRKPKTLSIEQCEVDLSKTDIDTIPNQRSNTTPGTPHGGGSSYSRNSIGDSMPVPSVGSPGSAAPSPHPNSALSQPTSVPPSDQLMPVISPRPPTSVPPLQQPNTPIDHLLDKNTPAPTPTDQHDNKSITASPYVQPTPSVEPPPSAEGMQCTGPGSVPPPPSVERCTPNLQCGTISVKKFETTGNNAGVIGGSSGSVGGVGGTGNGNESVVGIAGISNTPPASIPGADSQLGNNNRCNNLASSAATTAYFNLFKRPKLAAKDIEGQGNDELFTSDMLHDFSLTEAWLNHPVKRLKASDTPKPHCTVRHTNLYDSHTHMKPPMPTPGSIYDTHLMNLELSATTASESGMSNNSLFSTNLLQEHEIKKEQHSGTDLKEKGLTGRNLFTAEGLNPSYNDLDQIFDNPDDEAAMQIHTPPDSNKSSNGCTNNIDDMKQRPTNNNNTNTSLMNNNNVTCNSNNNMNNSNANMIQAEDLTKMFPTPPSHEQHHPNSSPCAIDISMTDLNESMKFKQEYSAELGSPVEEKIDDWSYVYMPQQMCKFVGSTKYAPLTNLPSQTLPPLIIPPNSVYKPSWQQPPPQRQQQQQQQQQQQHQQQQQQQQQQQHHQQQQQQQKQQQQLLQQHHQELMSSTNPNSLHPMQMHQQLHQPPPPPPSSTGSNLLLNQLNCPQAALTNTNNPMMQQMLRAGMSPISPAPGVIPPPQGTPGAIFPPSPMMNRRTPLHPPPPYEVATSSPSNSTSSYLNKQFHSQEPPQTPSAPGSNASCCIRLPEVSSLMVNILLYDTALNVFRDHNFDSCTLCVCNADSAKCVGNIRGADSGVYVALSGTSFNPANSMNGPGAATAGGAGIGGGNSSQHHGNNMRMLSAFGGLGSPALMGGAVGGGVGHGTANNHITGYLDDDPLSCSCGFSAVVNRRLAYKSGLFYEDEMEITGIAEDPAKYKKKSLLALLASLASSASTPSNGRNGQSSSMALMPTNAEAFNSEQYMILDLLMDQCTMIQTSTSSIHRALSRHRRKKAKIAPITLISNVLEYTDANDIMCLALEQARLAFNRMELGTNRSNSPPPTSSVSVHKWPYIPAGYTRNNKDIIHIMNSMQPLLQNAFHIKSTSGQKDATYTVSGPLTWRQFHRLAGRASGQCEPQPIPSVTVGYDKELISVAPFAIHYWDKLLLEPYSYHRDIVYLIICPENDYVISKTKTYFKELSTTYEMCKLGRHTPIKGWDGMLTVGPKMEGCANATTNLDEWLRTIEEVPLAEKIRMYANAFQNLLAPYLTRVPNDKTLLDPPESTSSGNCATRPMASPMPNSQDPSGMHNNIDKPPSTPPKPETSASTSDQENRDSLNSSANLTNSPLVDLLGSSDDDINPPIIVLYVVEPFTYGCDSPELERIACISLLRIYSELLKSIPESVRSNINIQILSLESILELGRNRNRKRLSDEIKCLALNIFSQCRRYLSHASSVKSLTGFGTAANMEVFLKSKDEQNRQPHKIYTPPYILAPMHEKADKNDFSRTRNGFDQQQFSVMYCNYCMSEDQSWLLATVTDDRGELLEKIIINIDIPNRTRRRKAPARRVGLQKLMDFIMGLISQTDQPWRLVIGRIGRIGHGELKSWSWLLSKQYLQKATKQLKDICKQCSLMYPPSILSACLVTLEPDSKLRVMPDQFTPDERFSQISMQNPLSTPQDVTCTHILVFPTSAVCQSFQKTFNELNETQVDIDNDFMFDLDEDPENPMSDVNMDLFWDPAMVQTGMERNSNHGSPDRMEDNRSWQSSSGNNFNSSRMPHDAQDIEEVGSVLQQPLAVGYFVSTAPTGRMPSWFWSACPHLEDVCPVFLKTALHLHVPNIQNTDDILNSNSHSTANDHPLDSNLTADVLRYVLEGYNALSWLALDSNTHDRLSCLPINVQTLMDLYHLTAAIV